MYLKGREERRERKEGRGGREGYRRGGGGGGVVVSTREMRGQCDRRGGWRHSPPLPELCANVAVVLVGHRGQTIPDLL